VQTGSLVSDGVGGGLRAGLEIKEGVVDGVGIRLGFRGETVTRRGVRIGWMNMGRQRWLGVALRRRWLDLA
jgi:hypothetical protein